MPYVLEFRLSGLTKMSNELLRGGWRSKHGHAKKWKMRVWEETYLHKPYVPLTSAKLTLTRVSCVEPDYDGLVSGFKPIIDGLVEVGVIASDKSSCIGVPAYHWKKGKRLAGAMLVKVESGLKQELHK
jgi:hypothetical protein